MASIPLGEVVDRPDSSDKRLVATQLLVHLLSVSIPVLTHIIEMCSYPREIASVNAPIQTIKASEGEAG